MPFLLRLKHFRKPEKLKRPKSLAYGRGDENIHNDMVVVGIGHRRHHHSSE